METKLAVNDREALLQRLDTKLSVLIEEFGGKVTHRSAQAFKGKWKEILKEENVLGDYWLPELLKRRGL